LRLEPHLPVLDPSCSEHGRVLRTARSRGSLESQSR
jgi:hypothetical protein